MNRRFQDFHHIAQGFPLGARRSSWAVAELEQEVLVWGLELQEGVWTSAVATRRRGLQRRWPLQLVWRMHQSPPFSTDVA